MVGSCPHCHKPSTNQQTAPPTNVSPIELPKKSPVKQDNRVNAKTTPDRSSLPSTSRRTLTKQDFLKESGMSESDDDVSDFKFHPSSDDDVMLTDGEESLRALNKNVEWQEKFTPVNQGMQGLLIDSIFNFARSEARIFGLGPTLLIGVQWFSVAEHLRLIRQSIYGREMNEPYAMGGYEVTADSEQPMMSSVCLLALKTDQSLPPKMSHVGVFDVTYIRSIGDVAGTPQSEGTLMVVWLIGITLMPGRTFFKGLPHGPIAMGAKLRELQFQDNAVVVASHSNHQYSNC
ncbi:unnamed protein product [Larinioides sclopetarius]|uniref:Uncharacterized protein n=1 Tax=Larinioides sclopetarius TaxID=280406 RepID=A0AAV1ZUK0_9ARAC